MSRYRTIAEEYYVELRVHVWAIDSGGKEDDNEAEEEQVKVKSTVN